MKGLIYSVSGLFLMISCGDNSILSTTKEKDVIAKVGSESFERYSKGSSLLDGIYFELVKDDKNLLALEQAMDDLNKNKLKSLADADNIMDKPNQYFAEIDAFIPNIKDSLLRKEIEAVYRTAKNNNTKRRADLDGMKSRIKEDQKQINDIYTAFKIKKTIPIIEKYQEQNPINIEDLNKIIDEQKKHLEEVKKLK